MPERIQLRRTKGWRKPDGAVVVSRPSKWGNPFTVTEVVERYPSLSFEQCVQFVVNQFKFDRRASGLQLGYPSDAEVRAELAGRDLACWCPLDQPCHADVLLEIANAPAVS